MAGRAIGKTEKAEKLLRVLEQFAEYDSVNGGFVVTKFRGGFSKRPGSSLGTCSTNGVIAYIKPNFYKIHRLVWLWHYGEWPKFDIDHIDQDWKNNKIENLQDVPSHVNMKNTKLSKNNTSGINGVYWNKQLSKWGAYIMIKRKMIYLGHFDTKQEAAIIRKMADEKYGFSPIHGLAR